MRRSGSRWSAVPVGTALATLLVASGCGNVAITKKSDGSAPTTPTPSSATSTKVDTSAGEGSWLLGMTSAGGADGETSTTVYLSYTPSTGQATKHQLPGVKGASSSPEQAALLVSASRQWAIPDTGISHAEGKSGRLKVYSLTGAATKVVDIHERTGRKDVQAIGWAFDPVSADTLRVVDTKNRVWSLAVSGGKATQESTLPTGPWVFTNGFNRNSGEPWVESIDSDATQPPGNGPTDQTPITRAGGTMLPAGSAGLAKLPASPCRLGAGFSDSSGVTWAFCADAASVPTYYLPKDGTQWTPYGKPSSPVAPVAAAFSLVLPPAE